MTTRERIILLTLGGIVAIAALALSSSCALATTQHRFCDVGFLIRPGEVMDSALALRGHDGHIIGTTRLIAGDSICVLHQPLQSAVPRKPATIPAIRST